MDFSTITPKPNHTTTPKPTPTTRLPNNTKTNNKTTKIGLDQSFLVENQKRKLGRRKGSFQPCFKRARDTRDFERDLPVQRNSELWKTLQKEEQC
jgi:hypothetical protein